jgi:peptidyl-prolyl isomerase E (cyclophilin E)
MSTKKKNVLYVGGLDAKATEEVLHAAFIPFGELKSVQIPKDYTES